MCICSECGFELEEEEGQYYCPECDIETYFIE
jgi:Zn finger protein HypA/HybF involved in hydrogenase expression